MSFHGRKLVAETHVSSRTIKRSFEINKIGRTNMSIFKDLELPAAFKAETLKALRRAPKWNDWRAANPLIDTNRGLTRGQVCDAAEYCGIDLRAMLSAWNTGTNVEAAVAQAPSVEAPEAPATTSKAALLAAPEGFEGRDASELIAETLAPVSALLSPLLSGELAKALAPMAGAATRGPRVVTQTVVKQAPSLGASTPPVVNVKGWRSVRDVFAMRKSEGGAALARALDETKIAVCDYPEAPSVDPDYVWNREALAVIAMHDAQGLNPWLFGAAGTGKTEGVQQYAARTGRPFFRIAIERTTEPQELIGQDMPAKGGGVEWKDGKLTRAFRTPYAVVLIDEPTVLRPGTLNVFQTALDMRKLFLPNGEIVEAAQGVFIVAADNTDGTGDNSGRYLDTAPMNAAFLDRFAARVEFSFMSPAAEAGLIHKRTRLPIEAARLLSDYAATTRQKAEAGLLTIGLSPRRLLAWARLVRGGIPSARAFQMTVLQGSVAEDREPLVMLAGTSLDHGRVDSLTHGEPVAVPGDAGAEAGVSATGLKFPEANDVE
jgi:hypothetical protein